MVEEQTDEIDEMVWRVVYTPFRKPRKKDYSTRFIVVEGKTLDEARKNAKIEFERLEIPFKEKWSKFYKENMKDIMKDVKKRVDGSELQDIAEFINTLKADHPKIIVKPKEEHKESLTKIIDGNSLNGLQLDIDVNEEDFITNISPNNINIFDMENYNTYFVNSIDMSFMPNIKVVAKNIPTATLYLAKSITQLGNRLNTSYKNLRGLNIFNSKNLREAATVDIEEILK